MKLEAMDGIPAETLKSTVQTFLVKVTSPAFGAIPQREIELAVFKLMLDLGVIDRNQSIYSLMTDLKISRAKARNILFDIEMREGMDGGDLNEKVRAALSNPRGFVADGKYFAIGIENPVVQAHLKEKVREIGYLTDASFDASIVRITPTALASLVDNLMSDHDKSVFRAAMIDAGLSRDENMEAAIESVFLHISSKAIGDAATDAIAGYVRDLAALVTPSAMDARDRLLGMLRSIRSEASEAENGINPNRPG